MFLLFWWAHQEQPVFGAITPSDLIFGSDVISPYGLLFDLVAAVLPDVLVCQMTLYTPLPNVPKGFLRPYTWPRTSYFTTKIGKLVPSRTVRFRLDTGPHFRGVHLPSDLSTPVPCKTSDVLYSSRPFKSQSETLSSFDTKRKRRFLLSLFWKFVY